MQIFLPSYRPTRSYGVIRIKNYQKNVVVVYVDEKKSFLNNTLLCLYLRQITYIFQFSLSSSFSIKWENIFKIQSKSKDENIESPDMYPWYQGSIQRHFAKRCPS